MNARGKGKITLLPGAKIIQLPICANCQRVTTNCKCGKPHPRPAA